LEKDVTLLTMTKSFIRNHTHQQLHKNDSNYPLSVGPKHCNPNNGNRHINNRFRNH